MSTNKIAKQLAFDEMTKQGFNVSASGKDLLIDGKLVINVKGCNRDNEWAKKTNYLGSWDRIDPDRFDYFVGVSFDNGGNNVRYFVFSKDETKNFPDICWKDKCSSGFKNLSITKDDEDSGATIKSSEDKWDKINTKIRG